MSNTERTKPMSEVGGQVFVSLEQMDKLAELLIVIEYLYPKHDGMEVLNDILDEVHKKIRQYVSANKDEILCETYREEILFNAATGEAYGEGEVE